MAFPVFKTQAEIPKGFEELYEEKDGAWHPKATDPGTELKETLAKERELRKEEAKARKKAEDERADLERRLAAAGTGEEKDKVAKALAKFDADLAAARSEFDAERTKLQGELRQLKLTDRVKAAFLNSGGRPERADKMLRDTEGRLDLEGDRIVIKDEKGQPTTQSVDDFFGKTYKTEVPEFFTGTKAAGGGGGKGAGGMPASGSGKLTADEVIANPLGALQAANAESAA